MEEVTVFKEKKNKIRNIFKKIRQSIEPEKKIIYSEVIRENIESLKVFKDSNMILTYVSTKDEVDTISIIEDCFMQNKKIAIPYIEKENKMSFYKIKNLEELIENKFGILEPIPDEKNKVIDYDDTISLVPGLTYDRDFYRIGYGGGYYDRFFVRYTGKKIGVCYQESISNEKLPVDNFDIPVDIIVTQEKIYYK